MGSVTVLILGPEGGVFDDERIVGRLREADVVVAAPGALAGADAASLAGFEIASFEDLRLPVRPSANKAADALRELAMSGEVALVMSSGSPLPGGVLRALLSSKTSSVELFMLAESLEEAALALHAGMAGDLDVVTAEAIDGLLRGPDPDIAVWALDDEHRARVVARSLSKVCGGSHEVIVALPSAGGGFELSCVTLDELAVMPDVPAGSLVYAPGRRRGSGGRFDELVRTIAVLRGPGGCPWDREQTHASLVPHMIEEAYEAVAAIDSADSEAIADELGDVLLQVVLHAQIASDNGEFTIEDVISSITEKIRRRHPHVFGSSVADTVQDVARTWDAIKRDETARNSALDAVPGSMPALMRAQKISRRAASAGFEWEDIDGVWDKVHEEIDELRAVDQSSTEAAEELGDLLFALVNVARKMGIDSERALHSACDKFSGRFAKMEEVAERDGRVLEQLSSEEWDSLWEAAKKSEREQAGGDVTG